MQWNMSTANHRFKEQYLFIAAMLLLILLIMAGLLVVEWAENKRFLETQRQSVVEKASTIRVRLEALLNTDLLLAQSLIIEVATNKDITQDRFYKIADYFMEASHHIRNIGLAKGTVLTYVYPEKGNEKAIGLDYKKIPSQWPAVQRTIEGRKTVVAGPLNLVQGGIGIIGRTPIFVDTDNAGSETEEYFGLLSEVVDLPSMLETAGLDNKESPLKISIRGKDGLGAEGEVFYGPEELFTKEPVLMKVTLPGGGSWLMASVPVNGWEAKSPYNINYRIIAMVVGLIILFMFCNQQREMTRRKNAEKAREELIMELQKALSEVKQLSGLGGGIQPRHLPGMREETLSRVFRERTCRRGG
ncbi:MAG: CHASE domain-containing protein [Deltaproteobacteria bacterium]|nr:CHASE domain-containing protein [Deltaproteobacteria bacterium]